MTLILPGGARDVMRGQQKTLDLLKRSGSALAAISQINTVLDRSIQGVIPGTVALGSGSATVADDGTVTALGASRVSLNNVFDGVSSYEVIVAGEGSVGALVTMRMRALGLDIATGTYVYIASSSALAAGPTRSSSTTSTSFGFLCPIATGATIFRGSYKIFSPAAGAATFIRGGSYGQILGLDRWLWDEGGNIPTSGDGISIIIASGTMNVRVKVVKLT